MQIIFPGWLLVGAVLAAIGVACWAVQARRGMGVTSLANLRPWGSYIAGFIFFMGLSAGALVLAALPLLLHLPAVRPYSALAAFVALAALVVGGLFIFVDLGKPARVWRMVRRPNLRSPMVWDLILTVVYLVVALALLIALLADAPSAVLTPLAVLALLAGVADGITAFVFSTQASRTYWFSAVLPVTFFVAALASAGAVMALLLVALEPSGYTAVAQGDLESLGLLTAACLAVGLLLLAGEVITRANARSTQARRLVALELRSTALWVEVGAAVVAIVLLVIPATRGSGAWTSVAACLALVHLAVKRWHFVEMGFAAPNLEMPGVDIDSRRPHGARLVEVGLVCGLVGGFVVLSCLGLTMLPLGVQA